MSEDGSWGDTWNRIKKQAKIKSKNPRSDNDFPNPHRTADEILELDQDITDTLEEAADEVEEPPRPTRQYRLGSKLEENSELSWGKRLVTDFTNTLVGGTGTMIAAGPSAEPGAVVTFGIFGFGGGALASVGLRKSASKGLEYTAQKAKGDQDGLQGIKDEKHSSPRLIENRLSKREDDTYGFKAFRDSAEWTETANYDEIQEFLSDLTEESDVAWRVKRKKDHPLQVVGITAEYEHREDQTYRDRIEIAEEIAEEDGVSIEEILDIDTHNPDRQDPVPTEARYENPETTYEFVIVDTNPEHSFDIENDFLDYSPILENEDLDSELETDQNY